MKITGVMIYYYFVCPRKLWYYRHDITMESNSELVGIGKLIDESSYSREKRSILIDETIQIDFLKDWKIIHEVKKSKSIEEASIWQIRYYISVLREKGIEIEKGILDFPTMRRREEIYLTDEDEKRLEEIKEEIARLLESEVPPKQVKTGICSKCAYYELCYI